MVSTKPQHTSNGTMDASKTSTSPKRTHGNGPSVHYQSLASNIIALRTDPKDHKSIGVCSCYKNEGVTTVAANLALAISRAIEGKVLVIQTDPSRNDLAKTFRLRTKTGWTNLYSETCSLGDAVHKTNHDGYYVMAAGDVAKRKIAYEAQRLTALVDILKDEFEFVIFDLPQANELSGCFSLSMVLDGTLMVVQADRVSTKRAAQTKNQLERFGANIIGAVVNKKKYYTPSFLRHS